jgi:hypothetical protein
MTRATQTLLAIILLSGALGFTFVEAAAGADVATSADNVDRWIAELGDDDYQVRKAAADRLAEGGEVARTALVKVAEGPDPEIRFAARRLVTLIDDTEFNRRLAEFAADVDGSRGVTLPGWTEFSALVGGDRAARELFVGMQREESVLLQSVFDPTAPHREVDWEGQVTRLLRARILNQPGEFSIPVGSCATLLFLGALPDAKISDAGASGIRQLTQIPPLSESLTASRPDNAVRRLVCAWIVNCPNHSNMVLQQRLDAMFQHSLAECLPLALEMIEPKAEYLALTPAQQMLAILAVGKFGSEENLAALETLLDDRRECLPRRQVNGPGSELASVQIRDVALAALLRLTSQEPVAYGFIHARPHPQMLFDVTSLYLESDARRAAALEQWRAWRAQHTRLAPRPERS